MPLRDTLKRSLMPMFAAALLAGCGPHMPCPPKTASATAAPPPPDWHDDISDPDHVRLRGWRDSFVLALTQARTAGHGAEIDAQGPLLDPDGGADGVALAEGRYRCRTIKLGTKVDKRSPFIAFPTYDCVVKPSGTIERLSVLGGIQRPTGRLYPDTPSRMIFLGTMILSDETKPVKYGRDADRDLVGALQKIGNARWRLLLPNPAWESTMDVMEIVPAG
ncbi:MAG: hypothetical protein JWO65_1059 [Sphingomonas bacterium]|jgi:hypothetical protein|nr:hypothetical protein [Sphingomonas bacterium]